MFRSTLPRRWFNLKLKVQNSSYDLLVDPPNPDLGFIDIEFGAITTLPVPATTNNQELTQEQTIFITTERSLFTSISWKNFVVFWELDIIFCAPFFRPYKVKTFDHFLESRISTTTILPRNLKLFFFTVQFMYLGLFRALVSQVVPPEARLVRNKNQNLRKTWLVTSKHIDLTLWYLQ